MVIACNIQNNSVGHGQAATAVLRSLKKRKSVAHLLLGQAKPMMVQDATTGKWDQTAAFKIDHKRINNALEHIARGIYFYHYGKRWTGSMQVAAEWLIVLGHKDGAKLNAKAQFGREEANKLFATQESSGSNKSVFFYQVHEDPVDPLIMRLSFYGGTKALAHFL